MHATKQRRVQMGKAQKHQAMAWDFDREAAVAWTWTAGSQSLADRPFEPGASL
jgi:hypothetical protein